MFGFRHSPTIARRLQPTTERLAQTRAFHLESVDTGARLLGGRIFASSLAAYMVMGSAIDECAGRVRVVDDEGRVWFTSPANTDEGASSHARAA
jgi:hypothetical protein